MLSNETRVHAPYTLQDNMLQGGMWCGLLSSGTGYLTICLKLLTKCTIYLVKRYRCPFIMHLINVHCVGNEVIFLNPAFSALHVALDVMHLRKRDCASQQLWSCVNDLQAIVTKPGPQVSLDKALHSAVQCLSNRFCTLPSALFIQITFLL